MATYFVASGGSNTAPYDTWAKAARSLQTALTAATAAGDIVVLQYNAVPAADAEIAAATTFAMSGGLAALICASNDGGSAYTPTPMGTGNWIGNSTTNRQITLSGAVKAQIFGLTMRTAGTASNNLLIGTTSDDFQYEFEGCYFWHGNSSATSFIRLGPVATNSANGIIALRNCTFRGSNAAQAIRISATVEMYGCTLSPAGVRPTTSIFNSSDSSDAGGCGLLAVGCDFSFGFSAALVGSVLRPPQNFEFVQCELGTGYSMLATQSVANKSSGRVWVRDCASGDVHGLMGYADALGSVVSDTGIYVTSGAAGQSLRVVTTSAANYYTPFVTPWIDLYNAGTSSITPRFEILRNGSTTAFQDDEVWAEFMAKVISGSTQSTLYSDRMALASTPANQAAGVGLGSWTGESGTAWSGKVDSGSSLTPAELGYIRGRLVVGEPSTTVYFDPQIRT